MAMLRLVCPAASPLHPSADSQSVLCGVLDTANDGAEVRGFTDRGHVSPVMSGDRDPHVIAAYCAGRGIPGSMCSYVSCPLWQAAKEAHWADRKGPDALRDEQAARAPDIREQLAAGV